MCRRIFGTIFILIVAAVIGAVYLASQSPATHIKVKTGRAQEANAERRVQNALLKPPLVKLGGSAAKGRDGSNPDQRFNVRFSEDDINTLIASNPAVIDRLRRAKIDSAVVAFAAPDKMLLSAQMQVSGNERVISVSGTLSPTDSGDVAFHSDGAQVGLLPLPVSSNATLDDDAAQLLALAMPKLPITVKAVSIARGVLTLSGPRRPG